MTSMKKSRGKWALVASCVFFSVIIVCAIAIASEGAADGGHDSIRLQDLVYRCLNFALLIIVLFIVVKKTNIGGFFSARREDIKKNLDDLKRKKEEADARYRELEKKLREFEAKKKEIITQFEAEGAAEKEKIIAAAKERAGQIMAQTDLTIEREIEAARDRLMQAVVEAAAQKAQDIIVKEIKEKDQDQLVNEFIERVGKLH